LKDKLVRVRKRKSLEKGENWKKGIMRRKSSYVPVILVMGYLEETNSSHLKNLLMPISILMMMKDQRIIRITMLIISIMVKEMMIRVGRKVGPFL